MKKKLKRYKLCLIINNNNNNKMWTMCVDDDRYWKISKTRSSSATGTRFEDNGDINIDVSLAAEEPSISSFRSLNSRENTVARVALYESALTNGSFAGRPRDY